MRKFPIGPTMVALAVFALIGAFLLRPAKKPAEAQTFSVVSAPGDASVASLPGNTVAPVAAPSPTPTLAPGEDPPARREPGAINYADKGVLPAL
jgi:hypothetical protein